MVFLSGGYKVKLYDNKPGQASGAIAEIRSVVKQERQYNSSHFSITFSFSVYILSIILYLLYILSINITDQSLSKQVEGTINKQMSS